MNDQSVADSLERTLLRRAELDRKFIGSALAAWRRSNPGGNLSEFLGCKDADIWKIALVQRPHGVTGVAEAAKKIAISFEIDAGALVSLLRLADAFEALNGQHADSEELLLAARDQINHDS